MKITLTAKFRKHYRKRIKEVAPLRQKYIERVNLFRKNPRDPTLKNHKLTGRLKDYAAFSITGDIRVVYVVESNDTVLFVDIGTHNQVYTS